jgi:hypothetical protein
LKKALLFLLFGLLALVLTAAVAVYLIVKLALAPSPGEWPTRVRAGPFTLDVGVPTAIRLATSSWFAPWLAGRSFPTEHGPVHVGWNAATNTLELDCAPCSAFVPALGTTPIRLDNLRFTARRDAGSLNGVLEATPAATTVSTRRSPAGTACWRPPCPSCSGRRSAARWPCALSSTCRRTTSR